MNDGGFSDDADIPIEALMTPDALMDDGIDFDERGPALGQPTIVRWRDLPESEAAEAWATLRSFVDWLIVRYDISEATIPRCWWQHGAVVEELSALRSAWDVSTDPDLDGGLGPIGWHERFHLVQSRLREWYNRECVSGHRPPTTAQVKDGYVGWDEWIAEAHS